MSEAVNNGQERKLLSGSRKELDIELNVVGGNLPSDIGGHVFISYPMGSVNSGGLPFPEKKPDGSLNHEYGTPIMNGDGMLMRVSFDEAGKVKLTTRILKTPCYYADEATRNGSNRENWGFKNFGISRISMKLGARNLLNTASVPVKTKNNNHPFLLVTYDVGRPFAVNPKSMSCETPLGKNTEWVSAMPPFLHFPFPMVQSSAHPSYDPVTNELFLFNYTRSLSNMLGSKNLFTHLQNDPVSLKRKINDKLDELEKHPDPVKAAKKFQRFYQEIPKKRQESLFEKIGHFFRGIWNTIKKFFHWLFSAFMTDNHLFMMKWSGENDFRKWEIRDHLNRPISIRQCIHQTVLSKDYILITDTSFKFSMDLLVNNPFPEDQNLDRRIRALTALPMEPFTDVYIVKRKDLERHHKKVKASHFRIPLEVLHGAAEYSNPNGTITFYALHNSAACVAEWLRPYDVSKITGQPVDQDLISMFALGDLDIGRIGKYKIDVEGKRISHSKIYSEKGKLNEQGIGPNTWGISLATFRNANAATVPTEKIEDLFVIIYGIDSRMLSEFIFNLYKDYPNREIPLDEMLSLTGKGLPYSLLRLNTETMSSADYFQFGELEYMRSLQFIPKKRKLGEVAENLSTDGYIFITMQIGQKESNGAVNYRNEFWLFDAAKLQQGPVCKLGNTQVEFCFTLHSCYLDTLEDYDLNYKVNIKEDYQETISKMWLPGEKEEMTKFFEENVYPNFKK